jgi:hypothetical protein
MRRPCLLLIAALAVVACSAAEKPAGLPFTTFRESFAPGDAIMIEQVWIHGSGPRAGDTFRVGETEENQDHPPRSGPRIGDIVTVRGRYVLQSRRPARIGLSLTSRGPAGPLPVLPQSWQHVVEPNGTFELAYVVRREGELHVTFYPANGGSSFGGVYFRVLR